MYLCCRKYLSGEAGGHSVAHSYLNYPIPLEFRNFIQTNMTYRITIILELLILKNLFIAWVCTACTFQVHWWTKVDLKLLPFSDLGLIDEASNNSMGAENLTKGE